MSNRTTVLLAVGVLAAIGGGILSILLGNQLFMGIGAVMIIVGLVGLMPLFNSALN